ncbi:arylsulfotransferase family protein [Meridianimarinicoccus aquatilis]|uniref:Uncharacterized protein n=1 Tax=Meridianimarinicoccus aquatilis TaxID=2552766 RepID=A0A4R6AUI6_9RHOB|nr:arylsulfotransferase family protein [Fluviibacterium aquatile]QIE43984.1 hypothetical protein G5B39_18460 [Rhodobacteraceae bacterium SC52]TDL86398.1 hypothetical protein E2L05_13285 [Fluviibacterium aquatile]
MLSRILPILMPVLSLLIIVFGAGVFIAEYKIPPYRSIASGAKTIEHIVSELRAPAYFGQFGNRDGGVPAEEAAQARLTLGADADRYDETVIAVGGLNEYRELCPEFGCIAVEFDRSGAVLRSWPFRPADILAADITGGSLLREGVPAEPNRVVRPLGVQPYDNGDILVSFQSTGAMFPFAGGVARLAPDGSPVWFRFDYSHHWPTLLPDGRALVPDLSIGEGDWEVMVGPNGPLERQICTTGRPQIDGVHIIAPDGSVERRIDVDAALRASNWAALLVETTDPCDPLHINYVDVLDDTAPGGALAPGNLVLSLRNLSAVIVIDPETDEVTALRRGTFSQQHAVHHLEGSRIIMFDNWGGDAMAGGSRVLEVDLATGAERRVFPRPSNAEFSDQPYSYRGSHLDLSQDRQRMLVSFSGEGKGFELEIDTGRVIMTYDSLHDLRGVTGAPDGRESSAGRANLYGLYYVNPARN